MTVRHHYRTLLRVRGRERAPAELSKGGTDDIMVTRLDQLSAHPGNDIRALHPASAHALTLI